MEFTKSLIKGKLIKRYKRFFVDVNIKKEIVIAHCPNTGSMKGLLDKDNEVFLLKNDNPKRKLKYGLEIIKARKNLVGVNTHLANKIIYHGKILYYKDFSLDIADRYKIGYSKAKMKWAEENEYFVWTYFIENNILFNPDNNLESRFINDSPFSRFYLEIDNESSEMIGKYIGWQIIKSYMKNNDKS